jgi:hypothetical protein
VHARLDLHVHVQVEVEAELERFFFLAASSSSLGLGLHLLLLAEELLGLRQRWGLLGHGHGWLLELLGLLLVRAIAAAAAVQEPAESLVPSGVPLGLLGLHLLLGFLKLVCGGLWLGLVESGLLLRRGRGCGLGLGLGLGRGLRLGFGVGVGLGRWQRLGFEFGWGL